MTEKNFEYEVGLSFAGEQREYVERVARNLRSRGIRVFYDDYEKGTLWGKDLYAHLTEIYQHLCEYCIIFVSQDYAAKVWPNRERQSAQARALDEKGEYILPARFDGTPLPGLLETVAYIDLKSTSPEQLSDLIEEKVGRRVRSNYLPPTLDRLYDRLGILDDPQLVEEADLHARAFFGALQRMSDDERQALIGLIQFGCPGELPNNVHIHTDLLRRHTDKSVARLQTLLGDIRSLGFRCSVGENPNHDVDLPGTLLGDFDFFYLDWFSPAGDEEHLPPLLVASEMIDCATEDYCPDCGEQFLARLDFSQLASATASEECHSLENLPLR